MHINGFIFLALLLATAWQIQAESYERQVTTYDPAIVIEDQSLVESATQLIKNSMDEAQSARRDFLNLSSALKKTSEVSLDGNLIYQNYQVDVVWLNDRGAQEWALCDIRIEPTSTLQLKASSLHCYNEELEWSYPSGLL